jgi:uncharacterized protein
MITYFIVPGLGNSGEEHWQTYFETKGNNFIRINQQEWDAPHCEDWIQTIDKALAEYDLSTVVLIGHSLACTTIAHWAKRFGKKIKGALLVAPSDVDVAGYNFPTTGFSPIPSDKINFKTIVVASTNDEWVTLERATYFANNWGSEFINIGEAGHINATAGFGKWDDGLELLKKFD